MIESKKKTRKNSLQTFQKSVEITYANRLDEHEIECFHFYNGEPVLDVTECERWYSVFGRIRLTSVLTTPEILDRRILFVPLYSQTSNSLFDPLW